MNYYNSAKKQREIQIRCQTNVLQCLADNRDAKISFRIPKWMKEQIKESGKSEADFIISKLGLSMFKPYEQSRESWEEECEILFTNKEVNNGPPNNYPSL